MPKLKRGCINLEHDMYLLRLRCGPYGADKLAHCYAFCMLEACVPTAGVWALLQQWGEESDSGDMLANVYGQMCGAELPPLVPFLNRTRHCLHCCLERTYDIPYHI